MPQAPQDNSGFYGTNWTKLTDTHDQFFVGTMFAHEFVHDDVRRNTRLDEIYDAERAKITNKISAGGTVPLPTEEMVDRLSRLLLIASTMMF